ncbi:hypothetical protein K437DRAFT_257641 [Tilletiaria anomala UBC 951]|uniref:Secreted protein n=1 Tax=Tilletiaria anomala (strain ATCC 24038 / CBS 436.72 / UBC 951) TaxID=1037660 RepID=A0A066VS53_TILAU|nr:uncharacterized protein K437DRAFT_257641 [Tilletiaria anomala UBC 951]KDN43113.1 hypothetical protein K437DRAFT_257641 [Tilletiaria anomala UBC 951]
MYATSQHANTAWRFVFPARLPAGSAAHHRLIFSFCLFWPCVAVLDEPQPSGQFKISRASRSWGWARCRGKIDMVLPSSVRRCASRFVKATTE